MARTGSRVCLQQTAEILDANIIHVKSSLATYDTSVRSFTSTSTRWSPQAKPITIESDEDDSEVWADAFEYQDAVLAAPRLSPPTPKRVDVQDLAAFAREDHYARTEKQYEYIHLQPYRKPLRKDAYFEMKNYPTSTGHPPVVIYVTNENQFNSVIKLLKGPVLSVDLEWVIRRTMNISLIQVSDANTVLLIQIFRFPRFPPKLREILENPKIIKCGVAIMGADMSKLRDLYNVWAQGVCELSAFARLIDRADHGPQNRLISLSGLAEYYLGAPLRKGPVRASNWNQIPLSAEQREYAAIDAYAGYLIFIELERRRQERDEFKGVWPVIKACPSRPVKVLQPLSESAKNQAMSGDADAEAQTFIRRPRAHKPYKPTPRFHSTAKARTF